MKGKRRYLFLSVFALAMAAFAVGCGVECKHDYGSEPTKVITPATCVWNWEELWTCGICGEEKTLVTDKVPHTYAGGEVTKAATCVEAGVKTYYCVKDGCIATKTEVIPKEEHNKVNVYQVDPTCTTEGATAYSYCADCGTELIVKKKIPMLGHSFVPDPEVKPTCTESGLTAGLHCAVCGEVVKEQTPILATGHQVVIDPSIVPTCGKDGKTSGSHCTVCGEIIVAQQVLAATGSHNFVSTGRLEPTCGVAGYEGGQTCSVCGEAGEGRVEIPATGEHTIVVEEGIEPTCATDGKTSGSYCTVCEQVLEVQEILPAFGHAIVVDEGIAATCLVTGKTAGSHCSICGEVIVAQEIIQATGHTSVTDKEVKPTCTINGKTEGSHCSTCNLVLEAQKMIPAEHAYNDFMECMRCSYVYVTPGLKYKLSSDGTYFLIDGIDMDKYDRSVEIFANPSTLNGLPVRGIMPLAFSNIDSDENGRYIFRKVVLRGGTSISTDAFAVGQGAFSSNDFLETVVIKGVVGFVDEDLSGYSNRAHFAYCKNLKTIVLGGEGTTVAALGENVPENMHVFSQCGTSWSVDKITVKLTGSTIPLITEDLFDDIPNFVVRVPASMRMDDEARGIWSKYLDNFLYEGV